MKSLLTRALSGAVLVALMVGAILYSPESLLVLALLITVVSVHELLRLAFPAERGWRGVLRHGPVMLVCFMLVYMTYWVVWGGEWIDAYLLVLPLIFLMLALTIYNKYDASPLRRVGAQLTAVVYIAVPMALFVALGHGTGAERYNAGLVLFYVILTWVNDVGAYLVGVSIGRHRLFERLSPKKSWEGFFGGLVFTVLASVFLGARMTGLQNTPVWVWIIFGVVLTLSAVAGDLFESMLKREAGVKDSGNAIPGHGGFLDRFDAMLISLPFVYTMVRLWMA